MAQDGKPKAAFDRKYMGWNPNKYQGPATLILDTVVKGIPKKD